jgi:hypothetical protein
MKFVAKQKGKPTISFNFLDGNEDEVLPEKLEKFTEAVLAAWAEPEE